MRSLNNQPILIAYKNLILEHLEHLGPDIEYTIESNIDSDAIEYYYIKTKPPHPKITIWIGTTKNINLTINVGIIHTYTLDSSSPEMLTKLLKQFLPCH